MALTYTPDALLGSDCPSFSLPAVDGQNYDLARFKNSKVIVVVFMCNHCPYVQAIEDRLIQLQKEYSEDQMQLIGICSNDSKDYPEDSFENLKKRWKQKDYGFPYLYDESQRVAKSFGAVCTPDFFVYDSHRKLVYRGRLDDSWKDAAKVKRRELKLAVDQILSDQDISEPQFPSMGCSIKWKES